MTGNYYTDVTATDLNIPHYWNVHCFTRQLGHIILGKRYSPLKAMLPNSVTRTVTVYAVNPIPINSLSIASSSGDNFANAGRTITVTLDAESNDLGNFMWNLAW